MMMDEIVSCCEYGQSEKLQKLLNESPDTDLNQPDSRGYYALHTAVYNGNNDMIEVLISRGADPTLQPEPFKSTPLHVAAYRGNLGAAEILLSSDQTLLNSKDKWGKSALHHASYHKFPRICDLLLTHDCDVFKDNYNKFPDRTFKEVDEVFLKHQYHNIL